MSSGNGGGKGFFDNAVNIESTSGKGNLFENFFADGINGLLQATTGGTLGYENGQISNGVSTNAIKSAGLATVSGLKEVTGAKAAEDANAAAKQQLQETKANAEAARVSGQQQVARDQLTQSLKAGAARNATANSRSANKGTPIASIGLGDNGKDFLGL